MNVELLRDYCLQKAAVTEGFPFGDDTLVFKVGGKMFLLFSLKENRFNVKCDPELAAELRDRYTEVQPGYHMNKVQWNTIHLDGILTDKQFYEMVDHSYELIVKGLPKKVREELEKFH